MDAGNGFRFVIANPKGYDLDKNFTKDVKIIHNQEEALKDADFIYVKNWSSFDDYAAMLSERKLRCSRTKTGKYQ